MRWAVLRSPAKTFHQDLCGMWESVRSRWLCRLVSKAVACAVCGTAHDRDVNAVMNTLHAGVRTTHDRRRKAVPGIPGL